MTPLVVGVTGNIGSGKSSVARRLEALGAAVIDADALARRAVEDPEVLARIARELGPELVVDGELDRAATARRVFAEPEARERLDGIVHPWVRRASDARLAELLASDPPPPVIVLDVPLLFENGLEASCDVVIVADAPLEERVARVAARSGMEADEVRARDAAQMPLAAKVARADFVVDNAGTGAQRDAQVDLLWRELLARASAGR